MSNPVLRLARTAVVAFTLVGPRFTGALADDTSNLIALDEQTAFTLEMIDVITFVGADAAGNGYYASTSTGSVDFVVAGTPSTVRGGDTRGAGGTDIVTGGSKSAT